ncbi:MAG TPA: hypothetical protein VKA31_04010, partial [Mariprofundaceae bacterium]|nr:hypothetical protein [Mariprofundaceae bacterium]
MIDGIDADVRPEIPLTVNADLAPKPISEVKRSVFEGLLAEVCAVPMIADNLNLLFTHRQSLLNFHIPQGPAARTANNPTKTKARTMPAIVNTLINAVIAKYPVVRSHDHLSGFASTGRRRSSIW